MKSFTFFGRSAQIHAYTNFFVGFGTYSQATGYEIRERRGNERPTVCKSLTSDKIWFFFRESAFKRADTEFFVVSNIWTKIKIFNTSCTKFFFGCAERNRVNTFFFSGVRTLEGIAGSFSAAPDGCLSFRAIEASMQPVMFTESSIFPGAVSRIPFETDFVVGYRRPDSFGASPKTRWPDERLRPWAVDRAVFPEMTNSITPPAFKRFLQWFRTGCQVLRFAWKTSRRIQKLQIRFFVPSKPHFCIQRISRCVGSEKFIIG